MRTVPSKQVKPNPKQILVCVIALCAVTFCARELYRAVQHVRLRVPLINAVRNHDQREVQALLEAGADADSRDGGTNTYRWADIWQVLTHPNRHAGSDAAPALQLAVLAGDTGIVGILIENGADVNGVSNYWPDITSIKPIIIGVPDTEVSAPPPKYTALMDAAITHHLAIVQLLLSHGANPNVHPDDEDPPLLLDLGGRTLNFEYKMQTRELTPPNPSIENRIAVLLIEHGADIRYKNLNGDTALRFAVNSDWPTVLPLLQHGADVNMVQNDPIRRTILIEAAAQGDSAVIRFLCEHHADANARDARSHRTAIMELCHRYMVEEIPKEGLTTLLQYGAQPNLQDDQGNTALMEAAGVGRKDNFEFGPSLDAVNILLQHGADPNIQDQNGQTVLQKLMKPKRDPNNQDPYLNKVIEALKHASGKR